MLVSNPTWAPLSIRIVNARKKEMPIYTIGCYPTLDFSLESVFKEGPSGCYHGGVAFKTIKEAQEDPRVAEKGWKIYELEGTWEEDTYLLDEETFASAREFFPLLRADPYRINKNLKIVREIL